MQREYKEDVQRIPLFYELTLNDAIINENCLILLYPVSETNIFDSHMFVALARYLISILHKAKRLSSEPPD